MSKEIERLHFIESFQKGNKIVGVIYSLNFGGSYEVQLYDTVTKSLKMIDDEYHDIDMAIDAARKYFRSL